MSKGLPRRLRASTYNLEWSTPVGETVGLMVPLCYFQFDLSYFPQLLGVFRLHLLHAGHTSARDITELVRLVGRKERGLIAEGVSVGPHHLDGNVVKVTMDVIRFFDSATPNLVAQFLLRISKVLELPNPVSMKTRHQYDVRVVIGENDYAQWVPEGWFLIQDALRRSRTK